MNLSVISNVFFLKFTSIYLFGGVEHINATGGMRTLEQSFKHIFFCVCVVRPLEVPLFATLKCVVYILLFPTLCARPQNTIIISFVW